MDHRKLKCRYAFITVRQRDGADTHSRQDSLPRQAQVSFPPCATQRFSASLIERGGDWVGGKILAWRICIWRPTFWLIVGLGEDFPSSVSPLKSESEAERWRPRPT
eukprot:scaffold106667_cov31-Tisochrysis_lutea.AAC.6